MNLERLIAENLIRFKVKNMNYELFEQKVIRLLKEQNTESAMQNIELMKTNGVLSKLYKDWETSISQDATAVKLVKTISYVPRTNEPIILQDEFYNNFVTLEKGVKNPAKLQKNLDAVIAKLQEQGVKLEDPTSIIEIVSTATEIPAGVGPAPNDYPAGKVPASNLKLDHDYGGNLKYDKTGKPTPESREWARNNNNGNKFLAKQRGLSVEKYLISKGVKAKIVIKDKIVPKDQKREFRITALVQGNEKVINPIGTPSVNWIISANATISYGATTSVDQFVLDGGRKNEHDTYVSWKNAEAEYSRSGQKPYPEKEFDNWLSHGVTYHAFIQFTGGATINQSKQDLKTATFLLTPSLGAQLEKLVSDPSKTPASDLKFSGQRESSIQTLKMNFAGDPKAQSSVLANMGAGTVEAGGVVGRYLNSTGQILNGSLVVDGLTVVGSSLHTALLGKDLIAWVKEICQSLPKTPPSSRAVNDPNQQAINAKWQEISNKKFSGTAQGDFKQLIDGCIKAGIPGVAATIQTDPAYWKNAYFFDSTTKNDPPREGVDYGKLTAKTAPAFFEGATFAQ